jgi:uncharacterized protein (DUF1697 family)
VSGAALALRVSGVQLPADLVRDPNRVVRLVVVAAHAKSDRIVEPRQRGLAHGLGMRGHLGGVLQFVCEHDGELPLGKIIPHPDPQVSHPVRHANEAEIPAVAVARRRPERRNVDDDIRAFDRVHELPQRGGPIERGEEDPLHARIGGSDAWQRGRPLVGCGVRSPAAHQHQQKTQDRCAGKPPEQAGHEVGQASRVPLRSAQRQRDTLRAMAASKPPGAYVALLRGINVGGNNLIPMASLKATFERLGFAGVKTYIQSGNVLFRSGLRDARALERRIEAAVKKHYQCESRVVIRSREEMAALVRALPRSWKTPDPAYRYYVMFLRHTVDSKDVLDRLDAKPDVEEIVYRPGAILWSAEIRKLSRSATAKFVSTPLYKEVTIRNLNTTLKLNALLDMAS